MTESRRRLLGLLAVGDSATARDLADLLGGTAARVGMLILRARRAGLVRRTERGFCLSERGRGRLSWLEERDLHNDHA
jgi:DNA-binding MarR family transcriptional regulator